MPAKAVTAVRPRIMVSAAQAWGPGSGWGQKESWGCKGRSNLQMRAPGSGVEVQPLGPSKQLKDRRSGEAWGLKVAREGTPVVRKMKSMLPGKWIWAGGSTRAQGCFGVRVGSGFPTIPLPKPVKKP